MVVWVGKNGGDLMCFGVIGFCWGGCQVWLYVEYNLYVWVVVVWYGFVEGKIDEMMLFNLVDYVLLLKVLVFGLYGEKDQNIMQVLFVNMCKVIQVSDLKFVCELEIVVYLDVGYVFFVDYWLSYVKVDVEDGWKCVIEWFYKFGVM